MPYIIYRIRYIFRQDRIISAQDRVFSAKTVYFTILSQKVLKWTVEKDQSGRSKSDTLTLIRSDSKPKFTPLDSPVFALWTVHLHSLRPSSFIYLGRPVSSLQTVYFNPFKDLKIFTLSLRHSCNDSYAMSHGLCRIIYASYYENNLPKKKTNLPSIMKIQIMPAGPNINRGKNKGNSCKKNEKF